MGGQNHLYFRYPGCIFDKVSPISRLWDEENEKYKNKRARLYWVPGKYKLRKKIFQWKKKKKSIELVFHGSVLLKCHVLFAAGHLSVAKLSAILWSSSSPSTSQTGGHDFAQANQNSLEMATPSSLVLVLELQHVSPGKLWCIAKPGCHGSDQSLPSPRGSGC